MHLSLFFKSGQLYLKRQDVNFKIKTKIENGDLVTDQICNELSNNNCFTNLCHEIFSEQ